MTYDQWKADIGPWPSAHIRIDPSRCTICHRVIHDAAAFDPQAHAHTRCVVGTVMKDKDKLEGLALAATLAIQQQKEKGRTPILMVFAGPTDDFERAVTFSPTGLDSRKVIEFLYESIHRKD
jgi:hypothetical protein